VQVHRCRASTALFPTSPGLPRAALGATAGSPQSFQGLCTATTVTMRATRPGKCQPCAHAAAQYAIQALPRSRFAKSKPSKAARLQIPRNSLQWIEQACPNSADPAFVTGKMHQKNAFQQQPTFRSKFVCLKKPAGITLIRFLSGDQKMQKNALKTCIINVPEHSADCSWKSS
jgi:hypothetical protein